MKTLLLALVLATGNVYLATAQPPTTASQQQEIYTALTGEWTGVLEYRDYQSDGRVKLPTWLRIHPEGNGLRFSYIYDDGPTKTVVESSLVTIDPAKALYISQSETGKPDPSAITGLEKLKNGRGTLVLSGTGTDNNKPAEVRTTLRITRNLLEMTREVKLAGEDYKFRHAYTFTRSAAPSTMNAIQH
ncbi:hypothetical protein [Terriglobus tenax]|uniref:hypothetical protein n=1 Tax=Terriglobus tenax TaxID=1111115 RepID=UPI0021E09FAA|nr:hypothetical protein [Terriglobus tenax]